MFCTNCGKDNPDTNKFCLQCGKPLIGAPGAASPTASAPPPPSEAASPAAPSRSSRRLPLILGGVLLLVALAAAAWFLLPRLLGGGGGRDMLLVTPNRNGTVDLSVLRLGDDVNEAVIIAEGVSRSLNVALSGFDTEADNIPIGGEYGGFLPGTGRLISYFNQATESQLIEYRIGDDAPVEVFSSAEQLIALISESAGYLHIVEFTDPAWRCYVASLGEEAERVARGDMCMPTGDGARVVSQDSNNAGEVTVNVTNPDNGDEVTLLDDVAAEGFFVWTGVSADGSRATYMTGEPGEESVIVVDDAGQTVYTSAEYDSIRQVGFAGFSDNIYFIAPEDDTFGLYTASGGPWIEAPALNVALARNGGWIAVVTADEDRAGEVSVVNSADGAVTEVLSGDNLAISWTNDPARLVIKEEIDNELVLTAADPSGANPVPLFDESDYRLQSATSIKGDNRLFLTLSNQDGRSLFVAPLDGTPGFFTLEEWFDFSLLNASDDTLIFSGREDSSDEVMLFALPLVANAKLIELDDDAESYGYAVFAPDGRSVIYNATIGDNYDDVVVRQVRLDGEEPPEDLYDEVYLAAARWAEVDPFRMTPDLGDNSLQWTSAGQLAQPAETTGGEGEIVGVETERATEIRSLAFGSSDSGAITQNSTYSMGSESGYGVVYYFNGRAGDTVRIDVFGAGTITSNLDPFVLLLDEDNTVLATDDDGGDDNTDSLLTYTLRSDGEYYVIVRSFGGSYGVGNEMAYQVWLNYD